MGARIVESMKLDHCSSCLFWFIDPLSVRAVAMTGEAVS
jgi:hypothetical protein